MCDQLAHTESHNQKVEAAWKEEPYKDPTT